MATNCAASRNTSRRTRDSCFSTLKPEDLAECRASLVALVKVIGLVVLVRLALAERSHQPGRSERHGAITAKTQPGPAAASSTPASAGAASELRLSFQPETTLVAVSSSGRRARK